MERMARTLLQTIVTRHCGSVLLDKTAASSVACGLRCCRQSQPIVPRLHRPYSCHIRTLSTKRQLNFSDESRSEVPRKVMEQLRQDVLANSLYKNDIITSRSTLGDHTHSLALIHDVITADMNAKAKLVSPLCDDDILAMMSCMLNDRKLVNDAPLLLELLEDECCRRINTLDLHTMLLYADSFYVHKHSQRKYMLTMLQSIDLRWNSLQATTQNVIQMLFYIGTYRHTPIQLMERVENHLIHNIADLTGCQIGLVCHAFFSTNTALRSYPLLNHMSRVVLSDLPKMKSYLVANALKVFRHANFGNPVFYEKLGDANILRDERYISTIIHFVATYAAVRFVHDGVFDSAATSFLRCVLRSRQNHTPIRLKDFTKFLWAFSTLQRPVPTAILEATVKCAREEPSQWRRYPETFVECLVSLAMNGVYPGDLIDYTLSRDFLQYKQGRRLEQFYQTALLDLAVGIESPDFTGNRISPEDLDAMPNKELGDVIRELKYRQGLAPLLLTLRDVCGDPTHVKCHFILRSSKVADIELCVDGDNKLSPVLSPSHGAVDALPEEIQHSSVSQGYHQVAAGGSIIESMLKQKRGLQRMEPENIHLVPDSQEDLPDGRRITIKVMGWNQYAANRPILLGIHQMELRLLRKLGYEVLAINPNQATEFFHMTHKERNNFVQNNIFRMLNIHT